jgi:hypothetical protein
MGEPAELSKADCERFYAFAAANVEAVRDDLEEPPLPKWADGGPMDERALRFVLCQLLVRYRQALDRACDSLDTEGLEETAYHLRALDLDY